jgi:fibronectin type 3 domain-containing protein
MDVYRLTGDSADAKTSISEQQFLKRADRIFSIAAPQLKEHLNNDLWVFQDRFSAEKPVLYAHDYRYAVLFVNNKNQSAGLSNQASITPMPIPPPPAGQEARGTQTSIRLKWEAPVENMDGSAPPRNAGYNIYRTEDPKNFPSTPINATPITATEFEDANFRFEATYYYIITTVGSLQQPYPESLPSAPISIATKDVFPPAPPADFSAIVQGNTIVLLWEPSPSPDVAGYRLYRKEKGTEDRRLVQSELVHGLSFRDTGAETEKQYGYEIQAIDAYGNASLPVKADSEQR